MFEICKTFNRTQLWIIPCIFQIDRWCFLTLYENSCFQCVESVQRHAGIHIDTYTSKYNLVASPYFKLLLTSLYVWKV